MDNRFLHEGLSVNIGAPFSLRTISGLGHMVEPFLLFAWKLTSLCLYCSTCSLYSSGNIPSSMSCRENRQIHSSVFCPHWSGVVGPTTTQPVFTTTQGKFTTNSREKSAECYILAKFNHHSAHPGQNYDS